MIESIYSQEFINVLSNVQNAYHSPEDWRDQLMYFIMTDRFNKSGDTDIYNKSFDGKEWDKEEYDNFLGGNFKGITEKLDYLKELGVGAIWMTPPLKNCVYEKSFYGYGIQDFLSIDRRYGTEEELKELVRKAHAKGIYIIFDIVLNHVGNVFKYGVWNCKDDCPDSMPFRNEPYNIKWRDKDGKEQYSQIPANCTPDECVWPKELQKDEFYRKKGRAEIDGGDGDFASLKELVTNNQTVRNVLIKVYQYAIAYYDIDGFRIDTLKWIEEDFARTFGNAIREYALSIGKKNFFIFGEVAGSEEELARFIGRHTADEYGIIGVDSDLDFPLSYKLPQVIKSADNVTPKDIEDMYNYRKSCQKTLISSHGEAGQYFVTFLDNHDTHWRFYHGIPQYEDQFYLGISALLTLPGIPCMYYGTEQGLYGGGNSDKCVRQALWQVPNTFNRQHAFYQAVQKLTKLRLQYSALRYGRLYFRELSGDGKHFGVSSFNHGVLSYSRILNETEILVVINTHTTDGWSGKVVVDINLNSNNTKWELLYSNKPSASSNYATSTVQNSDGYDVRVLDLTLEPMEVKIIKNGLIVH